ncbi:MAG: UDP-glucose 4-epimerase GalE [Rhodobacteraceae bacterium]|jgi:UDP-glucose 4-epimerase|nr:UDP-glucose 4-epimerase GalE [Paracoccaceae bacterium]
MGQTVLLTGGAGYIGSHTFVALRAAGHDAVVLDNFSNARADVPDRLEVITGAPVRVYRGDVRDGALLARIFAENAIGAVIHFAALKAAGESVEKPLDYMDVNLGGLTALLKAMREAGCFRLVFSSSATVYGTPEVLPVPETAPRGYANPYGFTKLACEQILEQVGASDPRWAIATLRYFNPVGAHSSALIGEDPQDFPNNLVPFVAEVALGKRAALNVFGDDWATRDGTGVRDYIHVEDLARGHVMSLGHLVETGQSHTVNLGTGRGYSVLEMLAAYGRAVGRDLPHVIAPRRPGDVAEVVADPSKAAALLGFRAERGVDEMCASSWAFVSRRRNG